MDGTPGFHQTSEFYEEKVAASPSTHDGPALWQIMIAGSIAGSLEHMAMFPAVTLKTLMQAITSSCKTPAITLRQSLGSIMKLEGLGGFYHDIDAMGLGAGPAHAVVKDEDQDHLSHKPCIEDGSAAD
ncbi:mitoferrin-like [Forsythia ovata]|uniref:Mitoferrin-like n=1 Tax=Forsythia ovata TaxID=205694 RepID=A0ABD1WA84_9LAMI